MPVDRITINPEVCQGQATVRGTRITVALVLKLMGNGYTPADIVDAYPMLDDTDIRQCATYASWLASETWTNAPVIAASSVGI